MRLPLLLFLALSAIPVTGAGAQDTVAICHATGSPQSPYTPLTLDNAGVLEHVNHEDDLVPAPAGGCPASVVAEPADTPDPAATPEYAVPTPAPTSTPRPPSPYDGTTVEDFGNFGGDEEGDEAGDEQNAGGSGGARPPATTAAARISQPRAADTRHLPMTGGEMWLVAAAGLGFLLCGVGGRMLIPAAAGRPPGPSGH